MTNPNLIKCGEALIDTDQVQSVAYDRSSAILTFKNGDTIRLPWRDLREETSIRDQLSTITVGH
jgi:hypothetical protein